MNWTVGAPLKTLEKPPITREQLRAYATASGDPNLIHLDENFAKEAGFPSVIVHGMLSMAFLADLIASNFPEKGWDLARFKSRFRKVTFPADVIHLEGNVKKVSPDGVVTVLVKAVNQKGEVTTDGEADLRPR